MDARHADRVRFLECLGFSELEFTVRQPEVTQHSSCVVRTVVKWQPTCGTECMTIAQEHHRMD